MKNELVNELTKIKNWINENPTIIKSENSDGRIDSLLREDSIANKIAEHFENVTIKTGNRSFGDFYVTIGDKIYPVNIKLTSNKNNSNDNLVGMVSIIAHIFFNGEKTNGHSSTAKKLVSGKISSVENDYGFVSITKETGMAEVSSMITMEGYVVNPSNGFQANFNKIKTIDKTFKEGRQYILKMYKSYLRKKAEPYLIMEGID
ncbi:MAG: hypothetical protein ACOCP4_05635 [Candidatus Woesearchaeota archaeon]